MSSTPMDDLDRKRAMKERGITQLQVARALGVDQGLVSHVVNETKMTAGGTKSRRIMEHIAELLGLPVTHVFPAYERRKAQPPFGGKAA